MRRICLILLLPLLVFCQELKPYSKSFSQGPLELKVELDRTAAGLEDSIALSISAIAPKEYSVAFPDFSKGDVFKHLIVQEKSEIAPMPTLDGRVLHQRQIVLEPVFIREDFKIGNFIVGFKKENEANHEIETEEIALDISMPTDEEMKAKLDAEWKNINKPVSRLKPPSVMPYLIWSAVALVNLCLLVFLARYIIRRRREKALKPPPPLPPWVIALRDLDRLKEQNLVDMGLIMEFYNAVQMVLRTYIEGRFQIRAPELTTEEFLAKLRTGTSEVAKYQEQLEQFLNHCDLVRFAAYSPRQQDIEDTYNACRNFVNATIPAPPEPAVKEVRL